MEIAQAYNWINTTMRADSALMAVATGGVYQGYADISVIPPYALYTQQAGTDVLTMNAVRLWASFLMQIKMIGPVTNYAALITGADRIDALFGLVRATALPGGGGVLEAHRESTIAFDELVNGQQFAHLGGLYRIDVQGS